ncbi:MAG: serine/threonine protein kinase, partial [Verrucomicrobiae bacterium]|nr:serine/threonine protein kinase [Verrucomicrobiae bacterium]
MNEVTRNHFARSGLCPSCFFEKGEAQTCPACGYNLAAAESDWNRLRPGTVLCERYVVGKALGQGGFGVTYLGLDTRLHTKLAIKEYYPSGVAARNSASRSVMYASDDLKDDFKRGLEKFLEEARTLARFEEHPNIVSVKDFFEENGTAYMVMNYVEGKTLAEHLKERGGKIPFDEAMTILSPLMDALDEIHASGTIHRDLSPDNIFLTRSGQPKLLDFGASKS